MNAPKSVRPENAEWVKSLPPEAEIVPVTHVRGALLATSRDQIRSIGRFADYEAALSPNARHVLDTTRVVPWLAVEFAHEHFAAIDHLGLAEPEIVDMTEDVSRKISGTFMQVISSTLRTGGVGPWDVLPHYDKAWRRLSVGGALGVAKAGPKDAHLVILGQPLIKHRYYRIGLARHLVVGLKILVDKHAYIRELHANPITGDIEFLMQWV